MAGKKIRGITIELGADYTQVTDAFNKISKQLSGVDKSLKDVNKLLKLDPTNTELLAQKQGYLEDAVALTAQKLLEEQRMLESMPSDPNGELTEEQKALTREIEATKLQLGEYKGQLDATKNATEANTTEVKELAKEVEKAGKSTSTFGDMLKANLTADAFKAVGKAVVDTTKKLWDMGVQASANADNLLTLSTTTGLSTDKLQEYAYMAELVDVDVSTITGSISKMTNQMQSARKGTGESAEAFKALGISVVDSNGEMRDAETVFNETITALGQMDNETQRNAYAMKIFGKSAMELNPLIEAGAEGLEGFAQEAHEMGYVLDGDALSSLGSLDDAMQRSSKALDAVKMQIGTALAPVITQITEAFVNWARSVDWQKVGEIITKAVNGIGKAINWLIPIIKTIIEWATKAGKAIVDIFTGKFEFPKIKMPHFSIVPKGWKIGDLLKGTIPKLSVDFYAKGYDGMVLNGATLFGFNKNGQPMVGGERGREIIIGENKLKSLLGSGMTVNITVNESTNAEQTANLVMNKLQYAIAGNERTWK